jgi:hypothetical protein
VFQGIVRAPPTKAWVASSFFKASQMFIIVEKTPKPLVLQNHGRRFVFFFILKKRKRLIGL